MQSLKTGRIKLYCLGIHIEEVNFIFPRSKELFITEVGLIIASNRERETCNKNRAHQGFWATDNISFVHLVVGTVFFFFLTKYTF